MGYTPLKKGTLLIPSGPAHDPDRKHLFVICTDMAPDGSHLLVPITSWIGNHCDATCRLGKHEHPFLRHDSYVFYRESRIEPANSLMQGIREALFQSHDPMNSQTFLRIFNGICRSPHTPRKYKIYRGCGLMDQLPITTKTEADPSP